MHAVYVCICVCVNVDVELTATHNAFAHGTNWVCFMFCTSAHCTGSFIGDRFELQITWENKTEYAARTMVLPAGKYSVCIYNVIIPRNIMIYHRIRIVWMLVNVDYQRRFQAQPTTFHNAKYHRIKKEQNENSLFICVCTSMYHSKPLKIRNCWHI